MIGDEIFQYGEKIEWIGHIKSVPRSCYFSKSITQEVLYTFCTSGSELHFHNRKCMSKAV